MSDGYAEIALFITTVAGFAGNWLMKRRDRQWLEQDRALDRAERIAEAKAASEERAAATAAIIAKAEAEAAALLIKTKADAEALRMSNAAIARKLESVHQVTLEAKADAKVAYTEANGMNAKNAQLREEILAVAKIGTATAQLDQIQGTTEGIQETVERIDQKVGQ